jgi:hypothetical protein
MSACRPVASCSARERRYGHVSGPQKGSEARAARRAGRICGRGGSERVESVGGIEAVVERREAAMVRRRWDSVLRVAVVMQAAGESR